MGSRKRKARGEVVRLPEMREIPAGWRLPFYKLFAHWLREREEERARESVCVMLGGRTQVVERMLEIYRVSWKSSARGRRARKSYNVSRCRLAHDNALADQADDRESRARAYTSLPVRKRKRSTYRYEATVRSSLLRARSRYTRGHPAEGQHNRSEEDQKERRRRGREERTWSRRARVATRSPRRCWK